MNSGPNITHYSSQKDYLAKKPSANNPSNLKKLANGKTAPNIDQSKSLKDLKTSEIPESDSKVNISEKAQKLNSTVSKASSLTKSISEAGSALGKIFPGLNVPVPRSVASEKKDLTQIKKNGPLKRVNKPKSKRINAPGIFFINGMKLFGSSSNSGLSEMAKHIRGAKLFEWNQQDQLMEEILKRPPHQPIILVGHSFGGDTAVSVAKSLNSMNHGFRKIDLMVTLDSVGINNDIIPQNVVKNLNFIGNEDLFLNDWRNIARNTELTSVVNELRSLEHTSLDNSNEVQFKIFDNINSVLAKRS